jgi:hypothetical protein
VKDLGERLARNLRAPHLAYRDTLVRVRLTRLLDRHSWPKGRAAEFRSSAMLRSDCRRINPSNP